MTTATLLDRFGNQLILERRDDSVTIHAPRGPVLLNARGLRALRDLAHRERLPESALAPETKHVELAQGLRALADWVESAPEHFLPGYVSGVVYPDDTLELAREAARALSPATKTFDNVFFRLNRQFGRYVSHAICFYRATVCTSRIVGTKHVEAVAYPAHDEELLEWDCHAVLGEGEASTP